MPQQTANLLETIVQELAAMKLPKIAGFQFNAINRIFLVGLKGGAWIANGERSQERLEVVQEISYIIMEAVLLTLQHHLPGREWRSNWRPDHEGIFGSGGSIMSFRWSEPGME
jgi:hypothetical protein